MPAIKSSMMSHAEFKNGRLSITMKGGKTYHYENVPEETYNGLLEAKSVGSYFAANIKGKFDHLSG